MRVEYASSHLCAHPHGCSFCAPSRLAQCSVIHAPLAALCCITCNFKFLLQHIQACHLTTHTCALVCLQELASTDSVYDTEKLSERIAKLSGGVAVIKVSQLV